MPPASAAKEISNLEKSNESLKAADADKAEKIKHLAQASQKQLEDIRQLEQTKKSHIQDEGIENVQVIEQQGEREEVGRLPSLSKRRSSDSAVHESSARSSSTVVCTRQTLSFAHEIATNSVVHITPRRSSVGRKTIASLQPIVQTAIQRTGRTATK
jgi:hypothetical protein